MILSERILRKVRWDDGCLVATGALRNGYGQIRTSQGSHYLHRLAYEEVNGPIPEGMLIDHRCHNRACCNPDHLRLATPSQNNQNRRGPQCNSRSGVRGVSWHEGTGMWSVRVQHQGRRISGGYFHDIKDAEVAAVALRNRVFTHNDKDRTE